MDPTIEKPASLKRKRIALQAVAAATVVSVLVTVRVLAQEVSPFARIAAAGVELIDPRTGSGRRIYSEDKWKSDQLSFAPGGRRLALVEWQARTSTQGPSPELVVLDHTGSVLRRLTQSVQRYTWCGDDCLAGIVGDYNDDSDLGFRPQAAFVYTLSSGSWTPLVEVRSPLAVTYATFDSSLYFLAVGGDGISVLRYELGAHRLSTTTHRDIAFSPSGDYYLHFPDTRDAEFRIFDSSTDREISWEQIKRIGTPVQWVLSKGNYLLVQERRAAPRPRHRQDSIPAPTMGVPEPELDYAVVDVGTGNIVRRIHGKRTGWIGVKGQFAVLSSGKPQVLSEP